MTTGGSSSSSRREIIVAVEYPWIDPQFPDPIEDEQIKQLGAFQHGTMATIDVETWRKQRTGHQSAD